MSASSSNSLEGGAIFRACSLIRPDETVMVGLPDTIWFPEDALAALPGDVLSFTVTGSTNNDPFPSGLTPDGGGAFSRGSEHGLAGYTVPIPSTGAAGPTGAPVPPPVPSLRPIAESCTLP